MPPVAIGEGGAGAGAVVLDAPSGMGHSHSHGHSHFSNFHVDAASLKTRPAITRFVCRVVCEGFQLHRPFTCCTVEVLTYSRTRYLVVYFNCPGRRHDNWTSSITLAGRL